MELYSSYSILRLMLIITLWGQLLGMPCALFLEESRGRSGLITCSSHFKNHCMSAEFQLISTAVSGFPPLIKIINLVALPNLYFYWSSWPVASIFTRARDIGSVTSFIIFLAPVVQRVYSFIHWVNHYQLDDAINFDSTYRLHSDLSSITL